MKNLFICLTPLQALIAQALIRQTAPIPADLLMVCYPEADNAKFHHYYQQTAAQCQHSSYQIMPNGRFQREFALPKLLKNLEKSYQTIYAASIDNPIVQYPLSHLNFQALETFDDGTGNLYPNSILYQNPPHSLKRKIINQIQAHTLPNPRFAPTQPPTPHPLSQPAKHRQPHNPRTTLANAA